MAVEAKIRGGTLYPIRFRVNPKRYGKEEIKPPITIRRKRLIKWSGRKITPEMQYVE